MANYSQNFEEQTRELHKSWTIKVSGSLCIFRSTRDPYSTRRLFLATQKFKKKTCKKRTWILKIYAKGKYCNHNPSSKV